MQWGTVVSSELCGFLHINGSFDVTVGRTFSCFWKFDCHLFVCFTVQVLKRKPLELITKVSRGIGLVHNMPKLSSLPLWIVNNVADKWYIFWFDPMYNCIVTHHQLQYVHAHTKIHMHCTVCLLCLSQMSTLHQNSWIVMQFIAHWDSTYRLQ